MKDIYVNRFLVWLMFLVPIFLTGWWSVIVWTIIQLCLVAKEEDEYVSWIKRLKHDPANVKFNLPENLTKYDMMYLEEHPNSFKSCLHGGQWFEDNWPGRAWKDKDGKTRFD